MPHGTAMARLRKSIMFNMATRLGDNVCYRCNLVIDDIAEFTIEHKLPWEGRDPDLFWELSNIAFSHARCNRPHGRLRSNTTRKTNGPLNTAWCSGHQDYLDRSLFYKNKTRWNGVLSYCKECFESKKTVWYQDT